MFTGIIRHIGKVISLTSGASPRKLTLDIGPLAKGLAIGDSVAVMGTCLTATSVSGCEATFDVAAETLTKTKLGKLSPGDSVNLEPALRASDGLDGHIVQGHVDSLAQLRRVTQGNQYVMEFTCERALTDQMVPKGSVTIDGVSLTLVDVGSETFSVALIPETLNSTTLKTLAPGDKVNVEVDILGKYVRKYLMQLAGQSGSSGGSLTLDKFLKAGFE